MLQGMPLFSSNMLKYKTNIALLKRIKANANVSVSLNINCIYKYTHKMNCPTDLSEMPIHTQSKATAPSNAVQLKCMYDCHHMANAILQDYRVVFLRNFPMAPECYSTYH